MLTFFLSALQAYAFLNTVLWRVWAAGMAQQWSLAQQASAQDADNAQTLKEAQTALLLTHIANLQESLQAKASTPELVPMQQEVRACTYTDIASYAPHGWSPRHA